LKTERAQAEVDRRRSLTAFADALYGRRLRRRQGRTRAASAGQSAERLRDAVLKALQQIHALLNADQRVRLAYLLRTGTLAV